MAWIESHQELARHPKLKRFRRLTGASRIEAMGMLHLLWYWALDYAGDGDLTAFSAEELAEEMDWTGDPVQLFESLIESEFLDRIDGRIIIHDNDDYNGKLRRQREENARKQREWRERKHSTEKTVTSPVRSEPSNDDVTVTSPLRNGATKPNRTLTNQTKPGDTPLPPSSPIESEPFALFEAFCDEIGQRPDDISEQERKPQLDAAKTLLKAGSGPDDVRKMTRWLSGQPWIVKGGGLDMKVLAGQHAKWRLNGMPDAPPTINSPPNGTHRMTGTDFANMLRNLKEQSP